tara:strand:- start:10 stop:630 length:621 start_codon:yes stop_codon:yes gene_type:complete
MEVLDKVLFKDLSEERRWEVIHDGLQFSDFWWKQVQEDVESELEKEGISTLDFQWSGFYSQGDGASFTGNVDLNEFFKFHLDKFDFKFSRDGHSQEGADLLEELGAQPKFLVKEAIEDGLITGSIDRIDNRYSHYNTVSFNIEREYLPEGWEKEVDSFANYLEGYCSDWLEDKCRDFYSRLEKAYEAEEQAWYNDHMEDEENEYTP